MKRPNIRLHKEMTDYSILPLVRKKVYANRYIRKMSKIKLWVLVLVAQITILIIIIREDQVGQTTIIIKIWVSLIGWIWYTTFKNKDSKC